ncbi:coiled-coil domain-containing protein 40 [Panulirus ornatus]|uniref:coiled-coil domain-containing protein 40 n=1 Tax=Panulirus ornatus TaxID=150431 RepID=UPI003A88E628
MSEREADGGQVGGDQPHSQDDVRDDQGEDEQRDRGGEEGEAEQTEDEGSGDEEEAAVGGDGEERQVEQSSLPPPSPRLTSSPQDTSGGAEPSWEAVLKTLGPDHPLLRRFQEAKRKQLLEEKSQLQLRLRQLRQQTEDLKRENISLGAQLFDVQQAVTRAQVNLDKAKSERRRVREAREAAQETLLQAREEERTVVDALSLARKHEADLQREVERLGSRVAAVKAARAQSDGDVTTLTRALHNTAWDRANLEKDKMVQDMYVERLTAALERESSTMTALNSAIVEEQERTEALHDRARLQQEELTQLESEGAGVRRAWEANVVTLQRRCQEQSQARQHLQQLLTQQAELRAQLYNTRKAVKEEQLKHEQHSSRLLTLERDVTKQRERLAGTREETQQLAERHEDLIAVVDKLEIRCQAKQKEAKEMTQALERLYGRLQTATERNRRLEDLAVDKLSEHTAASRAAQKLRKRVNETRAECRKLEDQMVERERCAADAALKASDCRAAVMTQAASRDSLATLLDQLLADVARYERDLRKGQEKISANQCAVDRLNKELAKAVLIAGGSEVPPVEREERRLRLLLQDQETEKRALEEEALTVQRHLLDARKARDDLVQKTTRLQQELSVMRGRQTRLESEVERKRGALKETQRRQERLHGAVATLDARIHQEKQQREATSRESDASQTNLMATLQELEQEVGKKGSEIELLRKKKEQMEEDLLQATKERGEWERNLVQLRDAKDALKKETGAEGDLHAMRTEINRMQARWRALETTQKELSGQLEQSVSVEGALKTRTRATVEKLRRDPNSSRATRLMHEDILKRKITKNKKRLGEVQEATEAAKRERTRLEEEAHRKERVYAQNVRLLQEAATHLEEKLVKKQEEQLRLQECRARLRHLTALRDGRYKTLAAAGEEAQYALKARLVTRAHAYTGVVTQLEAGYPQMELKLRNIKILLHNFLE